MAFSLTAQLTTGTRTIDPSANRIWWNGATFGTNIPLSQYQDSTHISDTDDTHVCLTNHVNNTKYLGVSTVSVNGSASSSLPIDTGSCGLKLTFDTSDLGGASVATSGATFYAYDGTNDISPMSGVNFQAAEGGQSTHWTNANGSASALPLVDQSAATSHDFYIATSVSPTSIGAKTGKIKFVLTYI